VTHREHQIDLATTGQVDADLKIGLPNRAQQVGPFGQARVAEVERNGLLDGGQKLPERCHRWWAGHLQGKAQLAGDGRRGGQGLNLTELVSRDQKQRTHAGENLFLPGLIVWKGSESSPTGGLELCIC
jgi:hypothetical protein